MILVYGIPTEPPIALLVADLIQASAPHIVVSQRFSQTIECCFEATNTGLAGYVKIGNSVVHLSEIRSIYARPMDYRLLPEYCTASTDAERERIRSLDESFRILLNNVQEAVVVNRPRDMVSNASKPFQSQIIKKYGFAIPRTLITNDVDAIKRFQGEVGTVVYKSISGQRSIVQVLRDTDLERLNDVRLIPVQFQECVPGIDVRVHVIGETVFGSAILHDGVDYRDPERESRPYITEIDVPDQLKARCRAMCRGLGLVFGGIDLRIAPKGEVYCFEVNPSPGYSYYQANTGQPIASALAAYLVSCEASLGDSG